MLAHNLPAAGYMGRDKTIQCIILLNPTGQLANLMCHYLFLKLPANWKGEGSDK